jgi:hypothetical protein
VFELPSEYLAVAFNWTVLAMAIVDEGGVTKIELIEGLIKKPEQLPQVRQNRRTTLMVSTKRIVAARGDLVPV